MSLQKPGWSLCNGQLHNVLFTITHWPPAEIVISPAAGHKSWEKIQQCCGSLFWIHLNAARTITSLPNSTPTFRKSHLQHRFCHPLFAVNQALKPASLISFCNTFSRTAMSINIIIGKIHDVNKQLFRFLWFIIINFRPASFWKAWAVFANCFRHWTSKISILLFSYHTRYIYKPYDPMELSLTLNKNPETLTRRG